MSQKDARAQADEFRVGIVQHVCTGSLDNNIESGIAGIRDAATQGAQIICLQELFGSLYFCTVENSEFFNLAETVSGKTVTSIQKVAKELGVAVVVPFFERRAPGVYHNSAAVIDADGGLLGVYRKMHIPDDPLYYEKYYFTPGDAVEPEGVRVPGTSPGFQVFRTRFATIGVLICWDQWYPEGARITSLLGAEVLFFPTAIGWHPKEKAGFGEKQAEAWRTAQRAHAIANGVYVASPNRIGHEQTAGTDGIEFFGRSFISDPFGEVVAEASSKAPAVLVHACKRSVAEDTRRNWPFLRDRRIDAYRPILSRYLGSES